MRKVENIIDGEKERIDKYLKESSFERYIAVVQDELLVKNMNTLLNKPSGLSYMLNNHVVKDMKLLYRLYAPLQDCLRDIASQFKVFISLKGNEIVDSLEESMAKAEKIGLINRILDSSFVDNMISF